MRALASLWTWFAIGVTLLVGFCLQLVLWLATAAFDPRRVVAGRCFRLIGVTAAKLNPTWHFGIEGETPRGLRGRYVVVSNHESNADPFLISFLPWEMKWLGKANLFKIPIVGWSMWLAGDIPVVRGKRSSIGEALGRCAEWLEKEMPVMIFPEGTRSKDGNMLPFKDGAFRLAIDAQALVLPLAVRGTHDALPKSSWKFGTSRARVMVGTPIDSAGKTLESLKEEARAQIEAMRLRLAGVSPHRA
jgi:1-acyl-sn-glycerol-3-phosphate acyltransferase